MPGASHHPAVGGVGMTRPQSPGVVIVGASAAGLAAAEGLRDGGYEGRIQLIEADLREPYDRPMLSKGLLGTTNTEPSTLRTAEHLAERRFELFLGEEARGLDIDRRNIVTSDGEAVAWDAVVIATGSRARPLRTATGEDIPVLRTVQDLQRVRRLVAAGQSVSLIGAGFIGLEIAAALRERGISVTVFGLDSRPLEAPLGPDVADWLRRLHGSRDVVWRTGVKVIGVEGSAGDYRILLEDGSVHQSDVVVAGIGDVPRDEWLYGSGVEIADGVLTDAAGRTNVPGVWAAGDVARIVDGGRDFRLGHWNNAIEHGRQVGLNIARGEAQLYHGLRTFWTEQFGLTVRSVGTRAPGDLDEVAEGSIRDGAFVVLHSRDGRLTAVTSSGRDRSLRGYRKLLLSGGSIDEARELAARQRDPLVSIDTSSFAGPAGRK